MITKLVECDVCHKKGEDMQYYIVKEGQFAVIKGAFFNSLDISKSVKDMQFCSIGCMLVGIENDLLRIQAERERQVTSLEYSNSNDVQQLLQFFQQLIQKFQPIWNDIITKLFDLFIKTCLEVSYKNNKPLPFDFQMIYPFFQLFGLRNILPKTFERISAAIQWNVCTSQWINKSLLEDYLKNNLSANKLNENQAITQLLLVIDIIKNEEVKKEKFEKELVRDLEEI